MPVMVCVAEMVSVLRGTPVWVAKVMAFGVVSMVKVVELNVAETVLEVPMVSTVSTVALEVAPDV